MKRKMLICSVSILFLLLMGCRNTGAVKHDANITSAPDVSFSTGTPTLAPSATSTPTMTQTPAPTGTMASTLPHTSTPLPVTLTSLPTLAPDEAVTFVKRLLIDNAECELPCYWGVTPGESSWESEFQRFSTFADKIGQGSSDQLIRDGVLYERTVFTIYKLIPDYSDVVASHYYISNGTVFQISVEPRGTEARYSLHQLLTHFGEPDGIVIRILADTPINKPWYDLILFYQHKGIIAQYSSPAYYEAQKIQICPQKAAPDLVLIEPDSLTLSAMKRASYGSNFPSIEKLLKMEIDQFYEQMRNSNACLSIDPEILQQ